MCVVLCASARREGVVHSLNVLACTSVCSYSYTASPCVISVPRSMQLSAFCGPVIACVWLVCGCVGVGVGVCVWVCVCGCGCMCVGVSVGVGECGCGCMCVGVSVGVGVGVGVGVSYLLATSDFLFLFAALRM